MKMSNHMKKIYKYYLNLLVENQSALMAGKKECSMNTKSRMPNCKK